MKPSDSKRKIIFLDIDGTLIPEKTAMIPNSARAAIQRAQQLGHLVMINTGRVFSNIDPFLQEIGFDGWICGCGTYILHEGKVLLHHQTPHEICRWIFECANEFHVDPLFEAQHGLYCDLPSFTNEDAIAFVGHLMQYYDIKQAVPSQLQFDKFVTWNCPNSDLPAFIEKISPYFTYINRGEVFSEFVPNHYSKATGIQFVLDYFGLALENTYAIGDGPNDLPMLEYVAHSIVMGNAKPEFMFSKAEFVTKDILEDGIAYAFDHFILENA